MSTNTKEKEPKWTWTQAAREKQSAWATERWKKIKGKADKAVGQSEHQPETETAGEASTVTQGKAEPLKAPVQSATSPTDILEQLTGSLTGEEAMPSTKASALSVGQPIYGPEIGHGRVSAINGDDATVKVEDSNSEITEIIVAVASLITLTQAQAIFESWWVRGKKWRLQQGRWLWIVHELCMLTGHGVWKVWLDEHDDYPKSTAYDYIREYKNEVTWARQDQQAAQKKNSEGNVETSETRTFDPVTIAEDRKTQQRAPDTNADELKEVIGKEKDKRRGRERSHHSTMLTLQFKNLEPRAVTAFWEKKKEKPEQFAHFMSDMRQGIIRIHRVRPECIYQ